VYMIISPRVSREGRPRVFPKGHPKQHHAPNFTHPRSPSHLVDARFGEMACRIAGQVVRSRAAHGFEHQEHVGLPKVIQKRFKSELRLL